MPLQVAYYGAHYAAFVCSSDQRVWRYVDDASVRVVGSWQDVKAQCERGACTCCVVLMCNASGIKTCSPVCNLLNYSCIHRENAALGAVLRGRVKEPRW